MVIFVNKYQSDEPVNVVISHGDCTPMIDKMIQRFAKRSRNTKSEASNDSPLSGLFILPIAHMILCSHFRPPFSGKGKITLIGIHLSFAADLHDFLTRHLF